MKIPSTHRRPTWRKTPTRPSRWRPWRSPAVATTYYLGDTGRLPLDARRALCQLLIGPSIDQLRHAKLWPALIRSEAAIRSSLADLFLELVLDRDSGVAFTRQADTEDVDAPVLLRTSR